MPFDEIRLRIKTLPKKTTLKKSALSIVADKPKKTTLPNPQLPSKKKREIAQKSHRKLYQSSLIEILFSSNFILKNPLLSY